MELHGIPYKSMELHEILREEGTIITIIITTTRTITRSWWHGGVGEVKQLFCQGLSGTGEKGYPSKLKRNQCYATGAVLGIVAIEGI